MVRRALFLVSVSVVLLVWCTLSTIGALLLYHLFSNLFARARSYPLSFHHHAPTSLFASTNISSTGILRATVRLTLPESDTNLANSAAPIRVCVGDKCVRNTIALQFRSPVHRNIRAVVLAAPLLAGIVDEYQRVQIESILDEAVNSQLSVVIEAPLQVAEADVLIVSMQPSFTSYLTKGLLAVILAYWYAMLACAIFTFRMYSRLRTLIIRRLWPSGTSPKPKERSSTSSETCKNEPELVGSSKKTKPTMTSNASRLPIFGKSSPRSSTSLRRRRMTVKGAPDNIAPACLLNGTYVK